MEGLQSQQDSQALECQICLNEYSWRRRPKLLACRHTCCSACLGRMVTVRPGGSDQDEGEALTGPNGGNTGQRHAGAADGQRGHRGRHHHPNHQQQRPVALGPDERRDERDGIETTSGPGADTERQRGSHRRPQAAGGATAGRRQRDGRAVARLTQPGHDDRYGEPERDRRDMAVTPGDGSAKAEQNRPRRPTEVGGTESGHRESRTVTQPAHGDPGRGQRGGGTAVRPRIDVEDNPQRDVEAGPRDAMAPRRREMDSAHQRHDSPVEMLNTSDTGVGGTTGGQTEIRSGRRETVVPIDPATVGNEARSTGRGETTATTSDPRGVGAAQNEQRTDPGDAWAGREGAVRSAFQTVIVCPWCRGVTALPDGLSVNHLPDDRDKMAAVTPTTPPPPPPLTQECTPVFIRLLPSASSYLIRWSVDGDGTQETDGLVAPSSAHYLLPVYMERDDGGASDSVIVSDARHYLLSAGGAAYFDGAVEDAGEPGAAPQPRPFPRPATGHPRAPRPGTRDPSALGEAWREVEGLRERRRNPGEGKRSGKLWTRVCTMIVLGLVIFLLVCIVLHTVACPSAAFTMISCG